MKWPVLGFLLCFASLSEQSVIKCIGDKNSACKQKTVQRLSQDVNFVVRSADKPSQVECLADSEWESNCHKCKCTGEGQASCVKYDTCNETSTEPPLSCKPNTTFPSDCNMCACLDNGLLLCTQKSCTSQNTQSELPSGKDCSPGTTWKSQCNECFCSPDGFPACTEKACPGQENEPLYKCAPDTVWKDDCNNCWCTDTGVPTCTRQSCSSTIITDFNPDRDDEVTTEKLQFTTVGLNELDHNVVKRNPAELICKPNSSFKIDCNFCDCDAEGLSYSCTDVECIEDIINKDVEVFMEAEESSDHVERHSVCKARTKFYITCNLCQCNRDGSDYTCTNKPCPLPKDVELFHELKISRMGEENLTIVCSANRMFVKDCNTCWCNEDGTSYVCTRKVCVDLDDGDDTQKSDESKRKCKPNEVFELDCNTCRCNIDGKSFSCTRRACPDDEKDQVTEDRVRKIRATQQETPKNCQPGLEFRMDCNKCLCDNEGQNYSCTRIDCAAVSNNNGGSRVKREISSQMKAECVPGSEFKQRCNVCRCTADGAHATCTAKLCDDNDQAKPDFRCNPGEQFKRDCNDCTCSADGKDVFCTLRLCEQDINIQTA